MTFANPWAFLALILLPLLVVARLRGRGRGLPWSDLRRAYAWPVSWRQRLRHLPLVLELAALTLIIIGLARPQQGTEKIEQINHGIAIEMLVDRSSSMGEEFIFRGRRLNRLEAVKEAFKEFVQGNGDLKGRPTDLIGMVAFARYPETICPLTLAHGALQGFLDQLHLVESRDEDGTAIGDGIALAAARLHQAEEKKSPTAFQIKSKVIILLTDGRNNSGSHSPMAAAELAKKWGITIYAIGIGESSRGGGFFQMLRRPGVDSQGLTRLAEATGGRYWQAEDGRALREIYAEIDALEKSEIESVQYMDYREYFSQFIKAALLLLLTAALGRWFIWRVN